MSHQSDFDALLHRFEARFPDWIARRARALREPQAKFVRLPAASLLIVGGMFSFLPLLGLWMLPLGLLLLAVDFPALQPPLARMLHWVERRWPGRPSDAR